MAKFPGWIRQFVGRGQRNRVEPEPIVELEKADFIQIGASHTGAAR